MVVGTLIASSDLKFSHHVVYLCAYAGGDISRQRHQLSSLERGDLLHWAVSSSGSANRNPDPWWCQDGRCRPGNALPGPAADFWSHQKRYDPQFTHAQWYNTQLFSFYFNWYSTDPAGREKQIVIWHRFILETGLYFWNWCWRNDLCTFLC